MLRSKGTLETKKKFGLSQPSPASGGSLRPKFREASMVLDGLSLSFLLVPPNVRLDEVAHEMHTTVRGFLI